MIIRLLTVQSIVVCDFPEYSGIQGNDTFSSWRKTKKNRKSSAVSPRQTLSPRSCSTIIFFSTSRLSVPPAKKKDPHTTSFNIDESMQNSNLEGDTNRDPCAYINIYMIERLYSLSSVWRKYVRFCIEHA